MSLRALGELTRWLGPWAADVRPGGVARATFAVPSRSACVQTHVFRGRCPVRGMYVVVPGLHYDGPDDVRLDRFCRVLARSGFCVVAPKLPHAEALLIHPQTADHLEDVCRYFAHRSASPPPVLFSISFGSLPALTVAGRLGRRVDAVVTFGGFARLGPALVFAAGGTPPQGATFPDPDPLNTPALMLNVVSHLEPPPTDQRALEDAWRTLVRWTWGRQEMRPLSRRLPLIEALERRVHTRDRMLFRIGAGAQTGVTEVVEAVLRADARAGNPHFGFADVDDALQRLRCPLIVCHGRDADVVPWTEAPALVERSPQRLATRLLVTGMFGHTGAARPKISQALQEVRTYAQMTRLLASAGQISTIMRPSDPA